MKGTWNISYNFNTMYLSNVAVSRNGSFVCALGMNTSSGDGLVLLSSNYGVNWTIHDVEKLLFTNLATSQDGNYIYASAENSFIYRSTNLGMNWTSVFNMSQNWRSISISYNREYVYSSTSKFIFWLSLLILLLLLYYLLFITY